MATDPVRHAIGRCRWCGGFFVRYFAQWICENEDCANRQRSEGILKLSAAENESEYLYLPLPIQVDLQTSTVKRLLLAGAAGPGKSYGGRWLIYKCCRRTPGFRALLLRCSYEELLRNHLQFMHMEAQALGDAKYSGGAVRQMVFENGSIVFAGYCDDAADIPRHLGAEWDLIVFDEGSNFIAPALTEISARDRGSATAKANGLTDGRTLILTNPGGRSMLYLIDHYIKRAPDPADYPHYRPEIHSHIGASLEDNPYLSENYADETLSGLSAARYKQLRYGDWSVFAGQFFSTFDAALHVTDLEPA